MKRRSNYLAAMQKVPRRYILVIIFSAFLLKNTIIKYSTFWYLPTALPDIQTERRGVTTCVYSVENRSLEHTCYSVMQTSSLNVFRFLPLFTAGQYTLFKKNTIIQFPENLSLYYALVKQFRLLTYTCVLMQFRCCENIVVYFAGTLP